MKMDHNLEFLKGKIEQTGTALCTMHLPGFSNLTIIIHSTSVDRFGNIKFSVIDSLPNTTKDDLSCFGLRMFFYKKGLGYYLNVEAIASASHTSLEENIEKNDDHMLFIKARILSAEYKENPPTEKNRNTGFIQSLRKKLSHVAAGIFWI